MYALTEPFDSGKLKVSNIHDIFYEVSGKKDGNPVVFIHGGPGGGCSEKDRGFFDPNKYKIILFDQRGCGKSTPRASLEENTTWDLGSTLALVYAQAHPDRVKSLVLRGIFTARKSELDYTYKHGSGASLIFPDAWEEFAAPVPEGERDNTLLAYDKLLNSQDYETCLRAARAWSKYELATAQLVPNLEQIARTEDESFAIEFARIENHYFKNGAFLREGQILESQEIQKIRHIPTVVVQGRYDVLCPVVTAWDLKKAFPELTLHIVPDAGHSSREPGTAKLLVEATTAFADL